MQFKAPFVLILSFLVYTSFGQIPKEADTIFTTAYGQENGLLQLNPRAITKDSKGFLWIGTEDGLHKFNSNSFKAYTHNPTNSLSIPDDHIRDLLHLNDTLWIATNSAGIVGLDIQKDKFFSPRIPLEHQDLYTAYNTFHVGKNLLLFSLRNHFILYNTQTQKYTSKKLPKADKENYITCFQKKNDSILYIGTKASGIQKLNLNNHSLEAVTPKKLNNSILSYLEFQGTSFIGTQEGLYRYNGNSFHKIGSSKLSVTHLYKLNNESFFVGTKTGIFLYNSETPNVLQKVILKDRQNRYYESTETGEIYGDSLGNIWLGINAHGLHHYNKYQKKFDKFEIQVANHPQNTSINPFGFFIDQHENLWIPSGIGIIKKQKANKQFTLYANTVSAPGYEIMQDSHGTLWAGGFESGLLKYVPETDTFKVYKSDPNDAHSISDNDVIEIIQVSDSQLWVCTWGGGINVFDMKTEKFSPLLLQNRKINRARISFRDSQNKLWIGTDEGLYTVDTNQKVTHISNTDKHQIVASNRIFAINEDSQHNIWIGTSSGITKMNPNGTTTNYLQQKGFPNDFVYGILIDAADRIWVSTNYGISILNPKNNFFINYTADDGLQNNEFNGKAAYKAPDGLFYFGGIKGYNIIDPSKLTLQQTKPFVHIEEIELFNTPIQRNELYKDTLHFAYDENVLTIKYAALQYLNSNKCNYKFQLEGFDKDWRKVTQETATTYTNLPPGTYTFKVQTTDDLGYWSPNQDAITLIITPPFYANWWFKGIFIVLFLASGLVIYFYKTQKLKKDNLKLEHLILQRTQDLKENYAALEASNAELESQKNQVDFLLKELKHRVNNNFQLITSFINIQSKSVKDQHSKEILSIAKNRINIIANIQDYLNNSATGEINLTTFTKECTSKIIKALGSEDYLKFKTNFDLEKTDFNIKTSPTLYGLLLNEIITNVHKHAFKENHLQNTLTIQLSYKVDMVTLTVADNGVGFDPKKIKKTSLGVSLIAEMIAQIDASYQLKTEQGTTYIIWIPFRKY